MVIRKSLFCLGLFAFLFATVPTQAAEIEVKIDENLPYVDVQHEGRTVRIERIQDQENVITGGFAKTSRKCPPFCIHPEVSAPGVITVGELELIEFIQKHVERGTGLLIDARTPEWHTKGTIPASINIPFTVFTGKEDTSEMANALAQLGVKPKGMPGMVEKMAYSIKGLLGGSDTPSKLDFSKAKELLLWCNGPWCDQSPRAIRSLLKLGYPRAKLRYYRGGMQMWTMLGLTVVVPGAGQADTTN
jgi:rhodanese-related sulfurtransferase